MTSRTAAEVRQDGADVACEFALRVELEIPAVRLERVGFAIEALVRGAEEQLCACAAGIELGRLPQRRQRVARLVRLEERVTEREKGRDRLAVDLYRLAQLLRGGTVPPSLEQRFAFPEGPRVLLRGGGGGGCSGLGCGFRRGIRLEGGGRLRGGLRLGDGRGCGRGDGPPPPRPDGEG